jgi:hypothetical protein
LAGFPLFEIMMAMSNSDQLMLELETHVQRILECHKHEEPYGHHLAVTEKRGDVVKALTRFIDERIQQHLTKFAQDQAQLAQDRARR